jgi:hypothetical protein
MWFDKIVWNDFEQPQAGPKGEGQECPESSTSLHQRKRQRGTKKATRKASNFKAASSKARV